LAQQRHGRHHRAVHQAKLGNISDGASNTILMGHAYYSLADRRTPRERLDPGADL